MPLASSSFWRSWWALFESIYGAISPTGEVETVQHLPYYPLPPLLPRLRWFHGGSEEKHPLGTWGSPKEAESNYLRGNCCASLLGVGGESSGWDGGSQRRRPALTLPPLLLRSFQTIFNPCPEVPFVKGVFPWVSHCMPTQAASSDRDRCDLFGKYPGCFEGSQCSGSWLLPALILLPILENFP